MSFMVGEKRLELLHIAALDPKSSASTNFATRPHFRFFGMDKALSIPRYYNLTQPSLSVKRFLFFIRLKLLSQTTCPKENCTLPLSGKILIFHSTFFRMDAFFELHNQHLQRQIFFSFSA